MLNLLKNNKYLCSILLGLILLFGISKNSYAQSKSILNDLETIENQKLSKRIHHNKRAFIFNGQSKDFKSLNPVSLAFGGVLFLYQNSISQHFSADCLYDPTCSDFCKQCVQEYGFVKGGLLTIDRLNRCNRISATDIRPLEYDQNTQHKNDPVIQYSKNYPKKIKHR